MPFRLAMSQFQSSASKRDTRPNAVLKVAGGTVSHDRKRLVMTVRGAATSGVAFLRRSDTLWRGFDDYYREYCRNFLVRGSIDARAFWATKEGFETVIEDVIPGKVSEEKKAQLKAYVDKINGDVKPGQSSAFGVGRRLLFGARRVSRSSSRRRTLHGSLAINPSASTR